MVLLLLNKAQIVSPQYPKLLLYSPWKKIVAKIKVSRSSSLQGTLTLLYKIDLSSPPNIQEDTITLKYLTAWRVYNAIYALFCDQ